MGTAHKEQATAMETQNNQQKEALRTEWGQAYEQNLRMGDAAASKFGIDDATMKKLEGALGFQGLAKFMHQIGSQIGEHDFVAGNDGKGANFGKMTPEQAKNRIQSLKGDPEFVKRYANNELSAREEMEKLHKFAYPE
jgi:hypothetical protein